MKRIVSPLFILLFSQNIFADDNEEFRATWVITWELINSANTVEANKARAREILDNHSKANMNAILWQCRQSGTAYYDSSYEPWGYYAGNKDPGYDPLAYAVEEAHKRGLELHAWFNVFQTSSTEPGTPAAEHPEWICRDWTGNPMTSHRSISPGLAAVREYTISVAMEIVRNYDIDGLHLDYIRWNEYTSSARSQTLAKAVPEHRLMDGIITEEQIQDLAANQSSRYLYDIEHPYSAGIPDSINSGQFPSWEDWWRWSVTEFVRVLYDSLQAVKPWVRLSVAALGKYNWSGWQGYGTVYQDAALWFNEGYIDQLTPMHYHWLTASDFYNVLASGSTQSWQPWIRKGITEGRLYSTGPGSYRFAENNIWERHPSVIEVVRTIPWVDGFQFFSYGSWEDYKYWEEAGATFFARKTKIRGTKLIVDTTPDAPTINLTKLDSLVYQIDIIPPVSVNTNHWFAIYRSQDDDFNVYNDEIIDIHFGDSAYSFTDTFSGTQDFNGTYTYFATTLDRFWNESEISNSTLSDSIPSFAPNVVAASPAEGDTIPVNSDIEITFSKTMELNSFQNAVSFNPALNVSQLIWTDDQKTLTVKIDAVLDFATNYTFTIEPFVTDINGKALDGNGDGISGDAFELHFTSLAQDVMGPQIIFSFPDLQVQEENFTIDEIITFLFDEFVDENSVSETSINLKQNENDIPFDFQFTTVENKSVLSIQPDDPLENDQEYTIFLSQEIADTLGNQMAKDITVTFRISVEHYTEIKKIDDFTFPGDWKQPDFSGSTTGIVVDGTVFGYDTKTALPSTRPKKSALLRYEWDESASSFLIREYLAGGAPRNVLFDTTYTLQCYVFGDGSNNKFRFAVDDSTKDQAAFHEVSKWITLDWYGWRIVEWQLNDPNSVGEWIGDGVLNGPSLRFDSFQLTHESGTSAVRGKIFFDNLRLVQKSSTPVHVAEHNNQMPKSFNLYQNYPNPFNPATTIAFDISEDGFVKLTVYDMLGREVKTLMERRIKAGHYKVSFDASGLASGVYFYRLTLNNRKISKRMLLMK